MFERFRKKKDEPKHIPPTKDEGNVDLASKTVEYEPEEMKPDQTPEVIEEPKPRPPEQVKIPEPIQQTSMSATDDIGIRALMDKRTKLEEAVDYVDLLIKNLKDKRTKLEKSIEDESVDIKNLKEKLMKVGQYIDEEKQGIKVLQQKRTVVEKEADDVGVIINNLREKLMSIDSIVNEEGSKIEKFKESRPKSES